MHSMLMNQVKHILMSLEPSKKSAMSTPYCYNLLDLSRVDRSNVVASVGQTENRNGSNPSASSSRLPPVSQGEYGGAPKLGSTLCFSHQRESHLESGGNNPEDLDDADQAFLLNHIRKGTRGTYKSGWC